MRLVILERSGVAKIDLVSPSPSPSPSPYSPIIDDGVDTRPPLGQDVAVVIVQQAPCEHY